MSFGSQRKWKEMSQWDRLQVHPCHTWYYWYWSFYFFCQFVCIHQVITYPLTITVSFYRGKEETFAWENLHDEQQLILAPPVRELTISLKPSSQLEGLSKGLKDIWALFFRCSQAQEAKLHGKKIISKYPVESCIQQPRSSEITDICSNFEHLQLVGSSHGFSLKE